MWKRETQQHPRVASEDEDYEDEHVCLPIELSSDATAPARATADAAGFDLCASDDVTIPPQSPWIKIGTGVKMAIGAESVKNYMGSNKVVYGQIRARSGLTSKGIEAFHGTIDADYRGEIIVLVKNTTGEVFELKRGTRIAQLLFSVALVPKLTVHKDITAFETTRGDRGFGSTGDSVLSKNVVVVVAQATIDVERGAHV